MFASVEDFQKFSKGQFEAATQAATAFSTGVQQLMTGAADFSKQSLETGTAAMQSMMGSRSVETALQVQIDFAKSVYDSAVVESNKVGTLVSSTAQNVFAPLEEAFATARSALQPKSAA